MTKTYTQPYLVLPDALVGTDDALSCGWAQLQGDNINNAAAYALRSPVIVELFPQTLLSLDPSDENYTPTDEYVCRVFAPRHIPSGYTGLRWGLCHKRTTGAGDVAWRLYASRGLYNGPRAFDASHLGTSGADYWVDSTGITSGSTSYAADHGSLTLGPEPNDLFFVLTAQATAASTRALATSLTVAPFTHHG